MFCIFAHSKLLQGLCVGSFDEKEVRETVGAPDNFEALLLLAVGYPREKVDLTRRILRVARPSKKLNEVASEEVFGKTYEPQKKQ